MKSRARCWRSRRPDEDRDRATCRSRSPLGRQPAEGEPLIAHLMEVMEALLGTVEEETALVRAGKLTEAAKLEAPKADLSRPVYRRHRRIRASQDYLDQVTPTMAAELRNRHDLFRAVLQMNFTVLATAHAVSESIMRGSRRSSPARRRRRPMARRGAPRCRRPQACNLLTLSRVL